jgi:sigma-B regulation protein RsbQ
MDMHSPVVISTDGIPSHYNVQGTGALALVFAHGWGCDRYYWDGHRGYFAPRYRVVTIDLAGHGASGPDRTHWTVCLPSVRIWWQWWSN